jgi:hypothetical protein
LTRDWHGHNIVEYDLTPALFNATDNTLEEWRTFWHHIDGGALAGYIVDPISGTHRDLLCGGIADGARTTFPIPVLVPTNFKLFVDGVIQSSGAYTLHTASNLMLDDDATCGDINDYTVSDGTGYDGAGFSRDGLACVQVVPDGGTEPTIYPNSYTAVSAELEYTAVAAVKVQNASGQNYRARLLWYESDDSFISGSSGSNVSIAAADGWVDISVTATSPALTAKVRAQIERNDVDGTTRFAADCLAVCPGDFTRWHLPSQAPGLVEFDSAPASGARITAVATGKRVTRCRFEPGTRWSMRSSGHATVRSIRATEWVEF